MLNLSKNNTMCTVKYGGYLLHQLIDHLSFVTKVVVLAHHIQISNNNHFEQLNRRFWPVWTDSQPVKYNWITTHLFNVKVISAQVILQSLEFWILSSQSIFEKISLLCLFYRNNQMCKILNFVNFQRIWNHNNVNIVQSSSMYTIWFY